MPPLPSTVQLLEALVLPGAYPQPTQSVTIIQTHASIVALTDAFAYKLKKEVHFGFMDFSTLERRRFYCQEELRLNQRLSEGIYLEVVPLYQYPDGRICFVPSPSGNIIEYAVKMRRLEESKFLIHLIGEAQFDPIRLDGLAEKLAHFYNTQTPSLEITQMGGLASVKRNCNENFFQTQSLAPELCPPLLAKISQDYQVRFLEQHADWFASREAQGKIKDGHGDIRAEHIYLEHNQYHLYDCIEFNPHFRCLDQLNDLAFLLMDFEFRGRADLARYFAQKMLPMIEAAPVEPLLTFYKSYRAWVRGKVNALKAAEAEIPAPQREESRLKARRYFGLAAHYALFGTRPQLVVVMGGVATGKSSLARALHQHLGWPHLNSDVVRKQLAGLPLTNLTPDSLQKKLYQPEMSQKVYQTLLEEATRLMQVWPGVVLDATFRQADYLLELSRRAHQQDWGFHLLETFASEEVVLQRLKNREVRPNVSDMRLEKYLQNKEAFQTSQRALPAFQVNTEASMGKVLKNLLLHWQMAAKNQAPLSI
ncbi:MAG: AAA family ATPase [Microscillaceae bacterium]|nr:AAA family ATPase [Microscillaceae bacterium]